MLAVTWHVHLRASPSGPPDEAAAAGALARGAGELLDEETLGVDPLRLRFAYLRRHEAERLFRSLRGRFPEAVVWIETEPGLGTAE